MPRVWNATTNTRLKYNLEASQFKTSNSFNNFSEVSIRLTEPMNDVRSLLRSELASRGAAPAPSSTVRQTKKRKLDADDSDIRKKSKSLPASPAITSTSTPRDSGEFEPSFATVVEADGDAQAVTPPLNYATAPSTVSISTSIPTATAQNVTAHNIDEDEWAAFEREVAEPTYNAPPITITDATIEAAPVTAADLEQQAKEERMRSREETLEGEKEDAARHLEEEFDEMEELEARLRRLKDKREALRKQAEAAPVPMETGSRETVAVAGTAGVAQNEDNDDDEDDDDDDDEWDNWRFG